MTLTLLPGDESTTWNDDIAPRLVTSSVWGGQKRREVEHRTQVKEKVRRSVARARAQQKKETNQMKILLKIEHCSLIISEHVETEVQNK